MRPAGYAGDKVVFDRIDVDVIDVTREVVLVAYRVFPVTALPNPIFSVCIGDERKARGDERIGEMSFYAAPAIGVVGIAFGEGEDCV